MNCFRSQDVIPDSMETIVRTSAALTVELRRDATGNQESVKIGVGQDG